MENNDNQELNDVVVEKSKLQKAAQKISNFLRMIFINFFLKNTILGLILGFAIGSRLFEFGNFDLKGATVKIAGICKNEKGIVRADLADDEIIVSKSTEKEIAGVLRKTREYLTCNREEVSVKKGGTISELLSKTFVSVPEIEKMKDAPVIQKDPDYLQYVGKDIVLTGSCRDVKGELLENVIDRTISVTNISPSKDNSSYYIYGVRDDKVSVICDKKDVKFSLLVKNTSNDNIVLEPEKLSYVGKKVIISGICFPDMRVYKLSGEKPSLRAYNLSNTSVQIIEEGLANDKLIKLAGSILDRKEYPTPQGQKVSLFGHKIVCDNAQYPIDVKSADDASIEIEKDKPVDTVK